MRVTLTHHISAGHRLFKHLGKCSRLHGHNYEITFTCEGELDYQGMVIDFGMVKALCGEFVDALWDHRLLLWDQDSLWDEMPGLYEAGAIKTPFNPTAENMADYLLKTIPQTVYIPDGVTLVAVGVRETNKCYAEASISGCLYE